MCGRAGRPKYDKYGEAIIVAKSEEERSFLFDNYLLGETEEIFSKLGAEDVLRSHTLALIATSTTTSKESLMDFLDSTFLAHQTSMLGMEEAVDGVIDFLMKEEMLREEDHFRATFFGRRVSDLYIDPVSAVKMRDALRAFKTGTGEFGFLHAACATPDMLPLYLRRTDNNWLEAKVAERGQEILLPIPADLGEYEFFLAEVKTACVLDDWLEEMEEDDLLTKYGIGPGDLRSKVEMGEWLLYSMRELANIFNKDAYAPLTELMVRVRYGVRRELLDLVKLRGVGRARARSMFGHGIKNLDDVRAVEEGRLARLPKIGDALAKSIKDQVGGDPRKREARKQEPAPADAAPGNEERTDKAQKKLFDF
jgi:helicase